MKGFYERYIMPRMIDAACSMTNIQKVRERIVPQAEGVVLDVGVGGGNNLALFNPARVLRVFGLDPSPQMMSRGTNRFRSSPVPLELIAAGAEDIPLQTSSVDTVVLAFTGCTIPRFECALGEMRRVLRPSGRLLFVEHSRAPDSKVARCQDRLDRLWGALAGGCHLNREIPRYIGDADFTIERLECGYAKWEPRWLSYRVVGIARPSAHHRPFTTLSC